MPINSRAPGRLPPSIERKLISGARQTDRAMVVGNRAGIIEWANDAWTRVTGYALDESVGKPVQAFLSGVDVDPGVVDFVAGCFASGKTCEVEIPLTPPDRQPLWVQLRVEPLFDSGAEPSDFIAIATDLTEQRRAEERSGLTEVDLSELSVRIAQQERHRLGDMIEFDLDLPANLPLVLADEAMLERLVTRLIARAVENIADGWGTITLWSGILGTGIGPIFRGSFSPSLPEGHWAYLEVHDTGCFPSGVEFSRVTEPFLSTMYPSDALRYATALTQIHSQNGELRIESSPVGGTSVILLFPFAAEETGWLQG